MYSKLLRAKQLIEVASGPEASMEDLVNRLFAKSAVFADLSIQSVVSSDLESAVVATLEYLSNERSNSSDVIPAYHVAACVGNRLVIEAMNREPYIDRMNFATFLIAALMRIKFCVDQNSFCPAGIICELFARGEEILGSDYPIFLSHFSRILISYEISSDSGEAYYLNRLRLSTCEGE